MLFLLLRWVRIPSRDFRVIFLFFENVGPKFQLLILFFLTTLNILIKPQIGFKSAIQIYMTYIVFIYFFQVWLLKYKWEIKVTFKQFYLKQLNTRSLVTVAHNWWYLHTVSMFGIYIGQTSDEVFYIGVT